MKRSSFYQLQLETISKIGENYNFKNKILQINNQNDYQFIPLFPSDY